MPLTLYLTLLELWKKKKFLVSAVSFIFKFFFMLASNKLTNPFAKSCDTENCDKQRKLMDFFCYKRLIVTQLMDGKTHSISWLGISFSVVVVFILSKCEACYPKSNNHHMRRIKHIYVQVMA
jgi:cbb3-type cytochrome oxidase subunit 1